MDYEHDGGELAEKTQALEEASANLHLEDVTDPGLSRLTDLAEELDLSLYTGRVLHAGQSMTGDTQVHYKLDGGGQFISAWPAWAYELAKAAVLHGRGLSVVADGMPVGNRISWVYILGT